MSFAKPRVVALPGPLDDRCMVPSPPPPAPGSPHANRFLTRPQLARSYLYKKNTKWVTSTSSSGRLDAEAGRYVEWPGPFFSPLVTAKTETPASTLPHQNSQRISVPREQVPKKLKCEFSHANHQRAWGPRGFGREPNKLPASMFPQSLLTTEPQYTGPVLFIALFPEVHNSTNFDSYVCLKSPK